MTDWLSRQVAGVINFRLETDVGPLSPKTLDARIFEYYAQLRARDRASAQSAAAALPFDDPIDF